MKNLCRILFLALFIITPFIVVANNEPTFTYTTEGSIPSATALGDTYSITYIIKSKYAVKTGPQASLTKASEGFKLINKCTSSLSAEGTCNLILSFTPTNLGPHSATLTVKDDEFSILNTTIQTTVKNVMVKGDLLTGLPKFTAVNHDYAIKMQFTNTSTNSYATNVTTDKQFPNDFHVDTNNSTCLLLNNLKPQASCQIVGNFKPTQAQSATVSATLHYQEDKDSPVNLKTKTSVKSVVINASVPEKLPFVTKPNNTYPVHFHFTNESSTLPANITQVTPSYPKSGFTVKTDTCSKLTKLAPNQSCDLIGNYQPSELLGKQQVKMQINYTEGKPVLAQTSTYAGSKLYTVQLGHRNVCDLNTKDGTLSNCHFFMKPLFVNNFIINPQLTYSYHSNMFNGVTVCQLNQDGTPSHCKSATAKPSSAQGIAFDASGKHVYIGTLDTGSGLPMCQVNDDGTLSHCKPVGNNFSQPNSIVINPANTYLYATNDADDDPTVCQLAKDGTLNNCKLAYNNYSNHRDRMMVINPAGTYAYISTASLNEVDVFSINKDGTLGNRKATGSNINNPTDIAIDSTGSFAYINNNQHILICNINAKDGTLNNCKNEKTLSGIYSLSIY